MSRYIFQSPNFVLSFPSRVWGAEMGDSEKGEWIEIRLELQLPLTIVWITTMFRPEKFHISVFFSRKFDRLVTWCEIECRSVDPTLSQSSQQVWVWEIFSRILRTSHHLKLISSDRLKLQQLMSSHSWANIFASSLSGTPPHPSFHLTYCENLASVKLNSSEQTKRKAQE